MSIEYTEIRRPKVNEHNEVIQWVFGLSGSCTESGTTASFDCIWDVSDHDRLHYSRWKKADIDAEFGKAEVEFNFSEKVDHKIACKVNKRFSPSDFDYNNAPNN